MTKDEALRLALEVLADLGMKHYENTGEVLYKNTYTAIKAALEAKDEPVVLNGGVPAMLPKQKEGETFIVSYEPKLEAKDEPVAWMRTSGTGSPVVTEELLVEMPDMRWNFQQPLYTTPPQRTWVGLTYDEIDELSRTMVVGERSVNWLCYAIETKLKQKNFKE